MPIKESAFLVRRRAISCSLDRVRVGGGGVLFIFFCCVEYFLFKQCLVSKGLFPWMRLLLVLLSLVAVFAFTPVYAQQLSCQDITALTEKYESVLLARSYLELLGL